MACDHRVEHARGRYARISANNFRIEVMWAVRKGADPLACPKAPRYSSPNPRRIVEASVVLQQVIRALEN